MSTMQLPGSILTRRRERLLEAGFEPRLATALARDERRDLHALIELVERGCPRVLAVRILAPLEEEHASLRALLEPKPSPDPPTHGNEATWNRRAT